MGKGRILKFNKGMDYYFDLAAKYADDGKFTSSLEILRRLKATLKPQTGDWVEVCLEIALCYMDMGLFDVALNEYFKLMRYGLDLDEIFYSIAKCCTYLNLSQQAALYLNLGVELGVLLPEDGFTKIEIKESPRLRLVKSDSEDYVVEIARQLIKAKDESYAKQILETVDKSSPQFVDACNYMGIIALANNEPILAIERLNEGYEADSNNVMTITELIIAYHMANDVKGIKKYKDELLKMNISDSDDLFKAVICFSQIQDDATTVYYAEKIVEMQPYDVLLNCILAASTYNIGDAAKAKSIVATLLRVYGNNFILQYYGKLIDSSPKRLTLSPALAKEEQSEIIKDFSRWLEDNGDAKSAAKALLQDSYRFNQFSWFLTDGAVPVASAIMSGLDFEGAEWNRIFREFLVSTEITGAVKKIVLDKYLAFSMGGTFEIVNNYILQVFNPKVPNISESKTFISAYLKVYGAAAFLETAFDKKLNNAYVRLVKDYTKVINAFNVSQLSAVLAFESGVSPVFSKLKDCCEVFDCNYDDLSRHLIDLSSLIGNNEFFERLEKSAVKKIDTANPF